MVFHTEYCLTLYFIIKPLRHLWPAHCGYVGLGPSFEATWWWLFLRVSLTPFLSLSLWFRTTYPQLLLESVSEWKHKYVLQCFELLRGSGGGGGGGGGGAAAAAWCCCLVLLRGGHWCWLVLAGAVALPSVLWVLQTLYMNSKCQLISQPVSISQTKLRNELPLSGIEPWTSDTLSNELRNGPRLHTNCGKQNILWKNFFFRNFFLLRIAQFAKKTCFWNWHFLPNIRHFENFSLSDVAFNFLVYHPPPGLPQGRDIIT